jgi:hypothetical protein
MTGNIRRISAQTVGTETDIDSRQRLLIFVTQSAALVSTLHTTLLVCIKPLKINHFTNNAVKPATSRRIYLAH